MNDYDYAHLDDGEEEESDSCGWPESPCLICSHEACGWCPDCSPQVPEW